MENEQSLVNEVSQDALYETSSCSSDAADEPEVFFVSRRSVETVSDNETVIDDSWRSTFENVVSKIHVFLTHCRYPLAFAFITAAGPRSVALLASLTTTEMRTAKRSNRSGNAGSAPQPPSITPPYPPMPQWMKSSRAALPRSVDSSVCAILHAFGIPTYSELHHAQLLKQINTSSGGDDTSGDNISDSASSGDYEETDSSSPPLQLIIPVATVVILIVSKMLIAKNRRCPSLPSEDMDAHVGDEHDGDSRSLPCEESRSADRTAECILEPKGINDTTDDLVVDLKRHFPQSSTSPQEISAPRLPPLPTVDRQGSPRGDALAFGDEAVSPRSTASSEPTHGVRTTDPSRVTPRTSMLRTNSDAVLSGSMQKKLLTNSERVVTKASNTQVSSSVCMSLPELHEQPVATPPRIHTMETPGSSPVSLPSRGREDKSTLSKPLQPRGLNSSEEGIVDQVPTAVAPVVAPSSCCVFIVLTTPATQAEINAIMLVANKYNVAKVIVPKKRRETTTIMGSPTSHSAPSPQSTSPAGVVLAEVDDVASYCEHYDDVVTVGVLNAAVEDSAPLHDFPHPLLGPGGVMYCFDPQCAAECRIGPSIQSTRQPTPSSSPTAGENVNTSVPPPSLAWCKYWVHLEKEQANHLGLIALVNVCLHDRSMKSKFHSTQIR